MSAITPQWTAPSVPPDTDYTKDLDRGLELYFRQLFDILKTIFFNIVIPKASGNGIKVDTENPTFPWMDMLGPVRPKATGAGSPTLAVFRGGNVRMYAYALGDDGDGEFHIPHDWVPGTDLFLHIHWGHNGTSISGSLKVDFSISYAKGHNQANFTAEIVPSISFNSVNIATTPQYRHRIDEIQLSATAPTATQLDTATIETDGLILFHYDVSAIPTIGGGSPNKPFILFIDLHYQSTGIGTKQKSPDFWT